MAEGGEALNPDDFEGLQTLLRHLKNLHRMDFVCLDVKSGGLSTPNYCPTYCKNCDFVRTHRYGAFEAQRWNGRFIYYCPLAFIFIAESFEDENGLLDAALIAGPMIMGSARDFADEGVAVNYELLRQAPALSTAKVNSLAEVLAAVCRGFSPRSSVAPDARKPEQERRLHNELYAISALIDSQPAYAYPIGMEKKLQNAIATGAEQESKELLNQLLGHIFFTSNADVETTKRRVSELVVLLSRAAIEGGADANQIFMLNDEYMNHLERFKTLEALSVWLNDLIHKFVHYIFDFKDVKHFDALHKVVGHINENYAKKLTLDEIAGRVYLSKSYLSKIFKEEMRCSLTNYINKIRIEKSKALLLDDSVSLVDVTQLVGFDDQSYFTKVFKKIVGVSPGKYRETRGKGL
jgi:AraC-like DNA-binding protein